MWDYSDALTLLLISDVHFHEVCSWATNGAEIPPTPTPRRLRKHVHSQLEARAHPWMIM